MIYEIKVPSRERTKKITIEPCIKCGCDKLDLSEYDDQFGYISNITCSKCENKAKGNYSLVHIIKEWNNQNNFEKVIKSKQKQVSILVKELHILKEKQRKKTKK